MSAARNFRRRQAVRRTWASTLPPRTVVVFLVGGLGTSDATAVELLSKERTLFRDILVLPVLEGYDQVLSKVLHFFDWVFLCHGGGGSTRRGSTVREAQYRLSHVIKVDDDTFVQLSRLVDDLRSAESPPRRLYHGQIWTGKPIRDPAHKNWVSMARYPLDQFLPYASGAHYVLSSDLVRYLVENEVYLHPSLQLPGGNLEDAQLGMWLFGIGVRPTHDMRFVEAVNCHRRAISLSNVPDHGDDAYMMDHLWATVASSGGNPCSPALRRIAARFYHARHRLNPQLPEPLSNMGSVLLLAGRPGDAVRALEAAVALDPNGPPRANLNEALRYTDASRCDAGCRRAIRHAFEAGVERFASAVAKTYWS